MLLPSLRDKIITTSLESIGFGPNAQLWMPEPLTGMALANVDEKNRIVLRSEVLSKREGSDTATHLYCKMNDGSDVPLLSLCAPLIHRRMFGSQKYCWNGIAVKGAAKRIAIQHFRQKAKHIDEDYNNEVIQLRVGPFIHIYSSHLWRTLVFGQDGRGDFGDELRERCLTISDRISFSGETSQDQTRGRVVMGRDFERRYEVDRSMNFYSIIQSRSKIALIPEPLFNLLYLRVIHRVTESRPIAPLDQLILAGAPLTRKHSDRVYVPQAHRVLSSLGSEKRVLFQGQGPFITLSRAPE